MLQSGYNCNQRPYTLNQIALCIEMAEWDPTEVTIGKKVSTRDGKGTKEINTAFRTGVSIDTTEKYGATTNKQSAPLKNTTKLDKETEELKHERVSKEFSKYVITMNELLTIKRRSSFEEHMHNHCWLTLADSLFEL